MRADVQATQLAAVAVTPSGPLSRVSALAQWVSNGSRSLIVEIDSLPAWPSRRSVNYGRCPVLVTP